MTKQIKRGSDVAVCYDGKVSRRIKGTVLSAHSDKILVSFTTPDDRQVTHWFKRVRKRHALTLQTGRNVNKSFKRSNSFPLYHGYVPGTEQDRALMTMLFGAPGDYYRVMPWSIANKDMLPLSSVITSMRLRGAPMRRLMKRASASLQRQINAGTFSLLCQDLSVVDNTIVKVGDEYQVKLTPGLPKINLTGVLRDCDNT